MLRSTLVNLTITRARLTSRQEIIKLFNMLVLELHTNEHKYSLGNAEIYACEH